MIDVQLATYLRAGQVDGGASDGACAHIACDRGRGHVSDTGLGEDCKVSGNAEELQTSTRPLSFSSPFVETLQERLGSLGIPSISARESLGGVRLVCAAWFAPPGLHVYPGISSAGKCRTCGRALVIVDTKAYCVTVSLSMQ